MILTTSQQAKNFALYALQIDPLFDGLNYEALVGGLISVIVLVFGRHTFSESQLNEIADYAIQRQEAA